MQTKPFHNNNSNQVNHTNLTINKEYKLIIIIDK